MSDLPTGWSLEKLGRRIKLVGGYAFKSNDFASKGIPLIKISSIQNGCVDLNNADYISIETQVKNDFNVNFGDVLIAMSGATTGKIGKYDHKSIGYLNQRVGNFKIRKDLDQSFLLYLVSTKSFMNSVLIDAIGGAQPNISGAQIESIDCLFPKLEEQKKIAEILASLDKFIELTEIEIEKLKNLKKGIMQDLLTNGIGHTKFKESTIGKIPESWEVLPLKKICKMKSGDSITSENISDEYKYPCYGGNGLRGYAETFTHDGTYTLVGRQGALCGNVLLVKGKFYASEHAVVITPIEDNNILWLRYLLEYMNLNQYSESSAQPGLSVSKIEKLKVARHVFLEEQGKIAKAIQSVELSASAKKEKLERLKNIKKGLMQDLLTGKVRVKV